MHVYGQSLLINLLHKSFGNVYIIKQAHKSLFQLNLVCCIALKSFQKLPIHVYMYKIEQTTAQG